MPKSDLYIGVLSGTSADSIDALLVDFSNSIKVIDRFSKKIPKEVKNKSSKEKKIVIEALWTIIYSDEQADMYETNLMRRLSGLLYLDAKTVGDIKEKIKSNQ